MVTGNLLTRDQVGILPILHDNGNSDDIFVMNFGLWHPETAKGKAGYTDNLHRLGIFYNKSKDDFPYQLFMETPKQHFDSEGGDFQEEWKHGKTARHAPYVCQPVTGVKLNRYGAVKAEAGNAAAVRVAEGNWRNKEARSILREQYGMPLVPVYNISVPGWYMHRRNDIGPECSHYCHPSSPQLWVYMLYKTLEGVGVRKLTAEEAAGKAQDRSCVTIWDTHEKAVLHASRSAQQQHQHQHYRERGTPGGFGTDKIV